MHLVKKAASGDIPGVMSFVFSGGCIVRPRALFLRENALNQLIVPINQSCHAERTLRNKSCFLPNQAANSVLNLFEHRANRYIYIYNNCSSSIQ